MKRVLYVYAMTHDSGFAPCIKDNLLSLACCKGGKNGGMRTAAAKDFYSGNEVWILGVCGAGLASSNNNRRYNPVYLAKIDKVIEMTEYFEAKNEYEGRNDHKAYRTVNGKLESQPENPHTHKDDQERDMNGKYVLLSNYFVYWGEKCGESGLEIKDLYPAIFKGDGIKKGIEEHYRGYLVDRDFSFDIESDLSEFKWFPKQNKCNIITTKSINGEYVYIDDEESEEEHIICLSCGGRK